MKERLLDVVKWGLVLLIAGLIYCVVCPKYYFTGPRGVPMFRCNKITGVVELWDKKTGWNKMKRVEDIFDKVEKEDKK